MSIIETLKQEIAEQLQEAEVALDPPTKPGASFWIDFRLGQRSAAVEYRPGMGFGVSSTPSDGYGEGPDEVYGDVPAIMTRLVQILRGGQRTEPPRDVLLRQLRETRRISQEELANLLGVQQAAVSKLERRNDMSISSLSRLIAALGGALEVYARFPEYTVKICQFKEADEKPAK